MASVLITALLFGIPAAVFIWFIAALIIYLSTPKTDVEKRKSRRIFMVIPAIICGVMFIALIVLAALFAVAITHM